MATRNELRGLVLNAVELRILNPAWADRMVEDYLNLTDNLITLADTIDTKSGLLLETIRISSDYNIDVGDQVILCDTDILPINVTLPIGTDGEEHTIINVGSSGNNVNIIPSGTDLLFGGTSSAYVADYESILTVFNDESLGWW